MDREAKTENNSRFEVSYLERSEGAAGMRAAVERHGGAVVEEKPVEKVRLAYPIKKQSYAFLGCLLFSIVPSALPELQAEFRLNGELLRALIHRAAVGEPARGEEGREAARAPTPSGPAVGGRPVRFPRPRPDSAVLTNEALEKKIEEMK